jgi:hypothetical protein
VSTPKELWGTAEALVYSVDRYDPTGSSADDYPHYTVVYSYRAGEERYTGKFDDYRDGSDSYFHAGDSVSIRYCPERPERSFYPEAKSATNRRLLAFGVGAGLAVIVMLIVYFDGGLR